MQLGPGGSKSGCGDFVRGTSVAPQSFMPTLLQRVLPIAAIAGATALSAALGARATLRGKPWYRRLHKSPLTPPDAVFGPVWTGLYALEATSAVRVYRTPPSPERTRALVLWGAQQALNAAWSPLFFGLHRARAALVDIGLLGATLEAYRRSAREVDRPAASLVLPYLGWLGFAAFLNAEAIRRNPRSLHG